MNRKFQTPGMQGSGDPNFNYAFPFQAKPFLRRDVISYPKKSVHISPPCVRNEARVLLCGLQNAVIVGLSACDCNQGAVVTVEERCPVHRAGSAAPSSPEGTPTPGPEEGGGHAGSHSSYRREDRIGPPRGPGSDVLSCLQRQGLLSNSGEGPVGWRCGSHLNFLKGGGQTEPTGKARSRADPGQAGTTWLTAI